MPNELASLPKADSVINSVVARIRNNHWVAGKAALGILAAALSLAGLAQAETRQTTLLNVSYDVTREFYRDYNAFFATFWNEKTGEKVVIHQSHGGSSRQARAVLDGLEADVITMNQANDVDILSGDGRLIPRGWAARFPYNSAPYTSTTVFLVRKNNPRNILDWSDLIKPGVSVIIPNPKLSGNGRYSYLAAWGYIKKKGGSDRDAKDFVSSLFRNTPVLDGGGRAATTTFVQRGMGDVLLTFENEAFLARREFGNDKFDVVYPSVSVLAENPVSVVDKVVDKRGTRELATSYLENLYSEEAQELAARHYFRPRDGKVMARHAATFKNIDLFTVDEVFGSWSKAQAAHFTDGGLFDQIYHVK
ncbi:MAG TPA: sulfate ABC transporter substrate-binding protein [Nitrosospira sp.]|nr:sulfate ABC transporter substrate-binding protein [Nitrosospira sp.]